MTRDEVLKKISAREPLQRADLRGLDLSNAELGGGDFRRADLEGANLENAKLRGADLRNASLGEAFLKGADLREANLDKADLEGANLEGADLSGANLARASLDGANMTSANLERAVLTNAQLCGARLGTSKLAGAQLSHADLNEAYLGGSDLSDVDLENADLSAANLEEAVLAGAKLDDASLKSVFAPKAKLVGASLVAADLSKGVLDGADLTGADLRKAILDDASFSDVRMTGAKVAGISCRKTNFQGLLAEWVDNSPSVEEVQKLTGPAILASLTGEAPRMPAGVRYFGEGDVMRNASLEFGDGASVLVESRFEQCSIAIGQGTALVVGKAGVLSQCQINGPGEITIHGQFVEKKSPGIVQPNTLVVTSGGLVQGVVEQGNVPTRFGFESGCKLRLKILRAKNAEGNGER